MMWTRQKIKKKTRPKRRKPWEKTRCANFSIGAFALIIRLHRILSICDSETLSVKLRPAPFVHRAHRYRFPLAAFSIFHCAFKHTRVEARSDYRIPIGGGHEASMHEIMGTNVYRVRLT